MIPYTVSGESAASRVTVNENAPAAFTTPVPSILFVEHPSVSVPLLFVPPLNVRFKFLVTSKLVDEATVLAMFLLPPKVSVTFTVYIPVRAFFGNVIVLLL